ERGEEPDPACLPRICRTGRGREDPRTAGRAARLSRCKSRVEVPEGPGGHARDIEYAGHTAKLREGRRGLELFLDGHDRGNPANRRRTGTAYRVPVPGR